ncbi:F-box protein At1g10780 [Selaginella moellendorffii]|nr:F-box protein At1g10780 [Selaginella moellendorffii]XP_024540383.1 F-box protein At1g10780 [Selaginella moellendorffii]|eukprot:XP_002979477.2 F-box protein At1g10780 [Selaginella moellendorffii]
MRFLLGDADLSGAGAMELGLENALPDAILKRDLSGAGAMELGSLDTQQDLSGAVEGLMDVLPDAIVQHLLCLLSNAEDVAACSCVCKRWRELMGSVRRLVFPRSLSDKGLHSSTLVSRMVRSTAELEELVVYCTLTSAGLMECVAHAAKSLKLLEFRVEEGSDKACVGKLEVLSCSSCDLETLRLWGGILLHSPVGLRSFTGLRTLEVVGARIRDGALRGILAACPALRELALLGCDGIRSVCVELKELERCRLDFCGSGDNCFVSVAAPKLRVLEVQGASYIRIAEDSSLQHLSIAKQTGMLANVEVGKLPALASLSIRGLQWDWGAIQKMLQSATQVETLYMKIEFCGDDEAFEPFRDIDFGDFLTSHPKLKKLDAHGALFASLVLKEEIATPPLALRLEEANITIRSPLNAERKLQVLKSMISWSPLLRKVRLRITQMKCTDIEADEFFLNLIRLKCVYDFITID